MCKDRPRSADTSTSDSTAMIPMQLSWDIKASPNDEFAAMNEDDSSPTTTTTTTEPATMATPAKSSTATQNPTAPKSKTQSMTSSLRPLDLRNIEQSLLNRCESEAMDPIQSSSSRTGRSAHRNSQLLTRIVTELLVGGRLLQTDEASSARFRLLRRDGCWDESPLPGHSFRAMNVGRARASILSMGCNPRNSALRNFGSRNGLFSHQHPLSKIGFLLGLCARSNAMQSRMVVSPKCANVFCSVRPKTRPARLPNPAAPEHNRQILPHSPNAQCVGRTPQAIAMGSPQPSEEKRRWDA